MAIRVGKGRASVTIDGPIAEDLEAQIRGALNGSLEAMEQEADQIIADTKRTWPVRTGRSRDAFRQELRIMPDGYSVEVAIVTVDYARFIQSTKIGTHREATRLRAPMAELRRTVRSPEVRARIADAVKRALAGDIQEALDGR
jgi:hypothetical protein